MARRVGSASAENVELRASGAGVMFGAAYLTARLS